MTPKSTQSSRPAASTAAASTSRRELLANGIFETFNYSPWRYAGEKLGELRAGGAGLCLAADPRPDKQPRMSSAPTRVAREKIFSGSFRGARGKLAASLPRALEIEGKKGKLTHDELNGTDKVAEELEDEIFLLLLHLVHAVSAKG